MLLKQTLCHAVETNTDVSCLVLATAFFTVSLNSLSCNLVPLFYNLTGVFQYYIEVYTGEESKAGTDANVFLSIHGNKGDTGLRRLMSSKTNTNKFEQGNVKSDFYQF